MLNNSFAEEDPPFHDPNNIQMPKAYTQLYYLISVPYYFHPENLDNNYLGSNNQYQNNYNPGNYNQPQNINPGNYYNGNYYNLPRNDYNPGNQTQIKYCSHSFNQSQSNYDSRSCNLPQNYKQSQNNNGQLNPTGNDNSVVMNEASTNQFVIDHESTSSNESNTKEEFISSKIEINYFNICDDKGTCVPIKFDDDNTVYDIFYICDSKKKNIVKKDGEICIEINVKNIRNREHFNVTSLKEEYIDAKTHIVESTNEMQIDGDIIKLWVKTNIHRKNKYIIQFSFIDESNKRELVVKIRLKNEKENQRTRKLNDEKGNQGKGEKKFPKGYYIKKEKRKIIDDLLDIFMNNYWQLFKECSMKLSELKKISEYEVKIEVLKLLKELNKEKITNREEMKDLVTEIMNSNLNEKEKDNLLIMCFDIIYERFILFLNKTGMKGMEGMTVYLSFLSYLKTYKSGNSKKNKLIIIRKIEDVHKDREDDEDQNKKKRSLPEEESSEAKKQKTDIPSRNNSRQTNKNSEVEVLLVDH